MTATVLIYCMRYEIQNIEWSELYVQKILYWYVLFVRHINSFFHLLCSFVEQAGVSYDPLQLFIRHNKERNKVVRYLEAFIPSLLLHYFSEVLMKKLFLDFIRINHYWRGHKGLLLWQYINIWSSTFLFWIFRWIATF